MPPKIQLIVGLGNPGPRYEDTRHNIGIWFVELIAQQNSVPLLPEAKFLGRVGKFRCGDQDCWLLAPTTFMNHSGQSVQAIASFYKIPPEAILVVHDELDFPPGVIKFKQNGGHGGHNGLRDIIHHLHSNEFHRLRVGIGHPGNRELVHDFILSRPSKSDHEKIMNALKKAEDVLMDFLSGETQKATQKLHADTSN